MNSHFLISAALHSLCRLFGGQECSACVYIAKCERRTGLCPVCCAEYRVGRFKRAPLFPVDGPL